MGVKIKATSVMAKHLNDAFKRKGFDYSAKVVALTERNYSWYVGSVYDAQDYGDYDYNHDQYKAIMVSYPADYYACPRYISTRELAEEFNREYPEGTSITTFADYMAEVCEI